MQLMFLIDVTDELVDVGLLDVTRLPDRRLLNGGHDNGKDREYRAIRLG